MGDWTRAERAEAHAKMGPDDVAPMPCAEGYGGYACTRLRDHEGDHAAGTGLDVAATWPQDPPPAAA